MRNLKKFTVSLLTAATLITAFPFTAKAVDGEPIGSFLKERSGITVKNEEAEELFQDFLEEVSFTATDETWADILSVKGKNSLHEKSYDNAVPDSEAKISYADLTDFDCMVYNYTYCVFAILKNESGSRWETYTKDRDALVYLYQDFLNFKPTQGNSREAVNAAFEKIWDWQFAYIQEHDEPFDFVDQLAYSEMFPESEDESVDTESLSPQDKKELESAMDELSESDKKEIQQAVAEEVKAENDSKSDKAGTGIIMPVLIVVAVVALIAVFVVMRKSKK